MDASKGERLKILYGEPTDGCGTPGEILDDNLTIACGEGALKLTRLQRAGRAPMNAEDFLRGFTLTHGMKLS